MTASRGSGEEMEEEIRRQGREDNAGAHAGMLLMQKSSIIIIKNKLKARGQARMTARRIA
jgi:hypothetical protein